MGSRSHDDEGRRYREDDEDRRHRGDDERRRYEQGSRSRDDEGRRYRDEESSERRSDEDGRRYRESKGVVARAIARGATTRKATRIRTGAQARGALAQVIIAFQPCVRRSGDHPPPCDDDGGWTRENRHGGFVRAKGLTLTIPLVAGRASLTLSGECPRCTHH